MKHASINDKELQGNLETQLRAGQFTWLTLEPFVDQVTPGDPKTGSGVSFAIYSATVCNDDGIVFDAWVVSGGPSPGPFPYAGIYNQDCYPEPIDAVAAQLGRIVLDGLAYLEEVHDEQQK